MTFLVGAKEAQEFKTSLGNVVKPHLYKYTKISQVWWLMPVVLATTWEAEVGILLEPRGQRLQWAITVPLYFSLGKQDLVLTNKQTKPTTKERKKLPQPLQPSAAASTLRQNLPPVRH